MIFHYLKYFMFHAIGLFAAFFVTLGGDNITYGFLTVFFGYIILDAVLGDDVSTPDFKAARVLTWQLWFALPLICFISFTFLWQVGEQDLFNYGQFVHNLSGIDILANKASSDSIDIICAVLSLGLMIGLVGTITGHELTHRTWDAVSLWVGRWLLSFSFDANFSIEHVYGHHRYVSTIDDPATAPRGRNVYAHILISTFKGNISAWNIEKAKLAKRKHSIWSWHNVALRGYLMSAFIVLLTYLAAGLQGMCLFILAGLFGKALLEIVNYMEHYGIVRNPDTTPVQPRHSWNTNKRFSSWSMFNLTRHSHHHAQGEVPYHLLRPYPDAPMMINGYLTTIVIALIPPLWFKLMNPKVLEWDEIFASTEERQMAELANKRSGKTELMQVSYG